MGVSIRGISKQNKTNRKEIWFSSDEIQLLKLAGRYYATDATTTIRILIRTAIIQLIAKQRREEVPRLTAGDIKALEAMEML